MNQEKINPRHRAATARIIDDALLLVKKEGVGPAIDYMQAKGIRRALALRVLTDPRFHRSAK